MGGTIDLSFPSPQKAYVAIDVEACWVLYQTVCNMGKRVVDEFLGMMGRKRNGEWTVNATRYWKVSRVNTAVFGRLLKGSQQTVSWLKLKRSSPQT